MTDRGWALVTGAARRVGRALALAAAASGHDVLVHTRRRDDGEETASLVRRLGRRAEILEADLTDTAACCGLIARAPAPPTLLVNSASVFEDDRLQTLTPDHWDALLGPNLRAPILLAQAFAATAPTDSLIVNIIDQRVWRLNPRYFSYTISKAALWAATQTMAQALAPHIRVNAIGPGPTLPNIFQSAAAFDAEAAALPLGHPIDPDEIGDALRYLIGARSVTGQMIAVDGGQHLAWRTPDLPDD